MISLSVIVFVSTFNTLAIIVVPIDPALLPGRDSSMNKCTIFQDTQDFQLGAF